jgi:signal transduction histidine kinase
VAIIFAVVLGVVAVAAIAVGAVLFSEMRRITRELSYISRRETNAQVTSGTNWPVVTELVDATNISIVQNRQLRQDQIQQEQLVRAMMTNLTHDIKTPLTVASGYIQLMRKQGSAEVTSAAGTAPGKSRVQELEKVERNLEAVNHYLHYLMDFNLVQEKTTEPALGDVDVSALVESELFDAYDQLAERNLELTSTVVAGIHATTDPTLLKRVIQNLVGNWLKYASGEIAVSVERDFGAAGLGPELGAGPGSGARGSVAAPGSAGIPRNVDAPGAARVPEGGVVITFSNRTAVPVTHPEELVGRFFTADASRSGRSTGLGLSIVEALMSTLGGSMNVSANDNHFEVTLRLPVSATGVE